MLVPQTEITIALDGTELVCTVVEPGGYVIGADASADIVAQAEGISRYHAHLTVTSDEMTIQDLGSESGTFVAGALAGVSTRIWPNQKVLLGPAVLETRRLRNSVLDQSLPAPAVAVRRILPEEFLHGRKHEIAGTLGQGGMGAVLRAHEATTHRTVAMKVMLANMSEADVVRFIAEAQITSQLEHPNIVPVHELGVDEHDQVFYTMKMVQGVTLREVLDKLHAGDPETCAAYPLRRLLVVLLRVCEAVSFAHSRGVIHRDLKPDNVMIGDFGEVLVMDWGLAKVLGTPEAPGSGARTAAATDVVAASGIQGDSFTRAGAFVGTPHYMSPEQARGETETMDVRADIWALGAILRHILSLVPPVPGKTGTEIMANVCSGELTSIPAEAPHCPGGRVPESLTAVTQKAQSMDREQRYPSAVDFRKEIDAYLGGFATRAEGATALRQLWLLMHRHRAVATALVVLLVVSVIFVVRLVESEHRAEESAEVARTNEVFARQKEEAARHAREAAQQAAEKARQALAHSQISLADAAFRESNSRAMLDALNGVPSDLRDAEWQYLFSRADNTQAKIPTENGAWYVGVAANPKRAGVFAAASIRGEVAIIDAKTGNLLSSFPVIDAQKKSVWSRGLDFSPDGERLVVGSMGDGGGAIYRVSDGHCLTQWAGNGVDTVQFNGAGSEVLAVDDQAGMTIRDAATGEVRGSFPQCLRAALAPDGKAVVSQGNDLRVVNPLTHQVERDLYKGRAFITAVTMASGSKTVYFATDNGLVHGIDFDDGSVVFEERLSERRGWLRVSIAGHYLIATTGAADRFRGVRVWDLKTGLPLPALMGGVSNVEGVAIHPLSDDVMISGVDTRTWNIGTRPASWAFRDNAGSGVFFGDDFFPGAEPVRLEPESKTSASSLKLPQQARDKVSAEARGDFLVLGAPMRPGSGAVLAFLRRQGEGVEFLHQVTTDRDLRTMHLSPAGDRLVLRNFYADLVTWNTVTGEKLPPCDPSSIHTVNEMTWINNHRLAGVAAVRERGAPDWEERVMLWDADTGVRLRSVRYESAMDCIVAAPDGKMLAEAGADKNVRLRDAESLEVQRSFRAHDGPITTLAYHPTKPILATGSADRTVRLWNLNDLSMIEEIRTPGREPAALHFNGTGDLLACTDVEGGAFVWDLRTGGEEARVQGHHAEVISEQRERAQVNGRAQRWAEARTNLEAVLRLQPEDHHSWCQLAVVLVQLGDHDAYRKLRRDMLERFGATKDPLTMERTAKACLLEPVDGTDLEQAAQLGIRSVDGTQSHFAYLFFVLAKGLAQYRQGAFAASAETLQTFANHPPEREVDFHARAVRAMALARDKHVDEAKVLLAQTNETLSHVLPADGADQTESWHDFLAARVLLREAAAVVGREQ